MLLQKQLPGPISGEDGQQVDEQREHAVAVEVLEHLVVVLGNPVEVHAFSCLEVLDLHFQEVLLNPQNRTPVFFFSVLLVSVLVLCGYGSKKRQ